jgi:YVTN family beta-propeller protein
MKKLSLVLTIGCLIFSQASLAWARHITKVSVDQFPAACAINLKTNKVYVVNVYPVGTVDVLDGTSHTLLSSIPVGSNPSAVAVNQLTNRIYVTNLSDDTVSVIDGASDTVISTFPVDDAPVSVAVNSHTNRIYVVNFGSSDLSVIDGVSNQPIATLKDSNFPLADVAVNSQTNLVYVGILPDNFAVFDGSSNSLVYTNQLPRGIKRPQVGDVQVDSALNRLYIVDRANGQLFVIDGTNGSIITTVPLGAAFIMAVNAASHGIIVGTGYDKHLLLIDPVTFAVTRNLPIDFSDGIVVNPTTTEIYVSLFYLKTVAVLNAP